MCGFPGHLIKGRGDYASSQIFLPAASYGEGTSQVGTIWKGYYWSSAPVGFDYALFLYFDSGDMRGRHDKAVAEEVARHADAQDA